MTPRFTCDLSSCYVPVFAAELLANVDGINSLLKLQYLEGKPHQPWFLYPGRIRIWLLLVLKKGGKPR